MAEPSRKKCAERGCEWTHFLIADSDPARKIYELAVEQHYHDAHPGKKPRTASMEDLFDAMFGGGIGGL